MLLQAEVAGDVRSLVEQGFVDQFVVGKATVKQKAPEAPLFTCSEVTAAQIVTYGKSESTSLDMMNNYCRESDGVESTLVTVGLNPRFSSSKKDIQYKANGYHAMVVVAVLPSDLAALPLESALHLLLDDHPKYDSITGASGGRASAPDHTSPSVIYVALKLHEAYRTDIISEVEKAEEAEKLLKAEMAKGVKDQQKLLVSTAPKVRQSGLCVCVLLTAVICRLRFRSKRQFQNWLFLRPKPPKKPTFRE